MRKANTNSLLPFYVDPRERVRADHDGFGMVAHGRFLMPFSVKDDNIIRFQLVSDDGQIYTLDLSLLERLESSDSEVFYIYRGVDIGDEYCGLHSIVLTGNNNNYYSAWMNLKPACDDQRAGISGVTGSFAPGGVNWTFTFSDNVSGLTASSNILIEGTDRTPFTGTTVTGASTTATVERTARGRCGTFKSLYAISASGGGSLSLLDQSSKPDDDISDLWRFDFTDGGTIDEVPYIVKFTQSLYLKVTFAEPTAPADEDYWTNGLGERFLNYANTQDTVNAVAIDIPDDLIGPIRSASKAGTITATRLLTGITYPVNDLVIEFSRQADEVFNRATLSWVRNYYHADAFNDRRPYT